MNYYNQKDAQVLIQGNKSAIIITTAILILLIICITSVGLFFSLAENPNMLLISLCVAIVMVTLGIIIALYATRKLRYDLKTGETTTKVVTVTSIVKNKDYEPGSGVMYIPILGDLFPKLWGQKMNEKEIAHVFTDNNERYEIPMEVDQETKTLTLYFGGKSGIYLGCTN